MTTDKTQTVDALLDMTPIVDGRDLVRLAARHLFLCHVKGQCCIRDVFFAGQRPDYRYSDAIDNAITWFNVRDYSVLYVCQAICRLKDEFGLHDMLDEAVIEERLSIAHNSSAWKKVGFALYTILFPDLVKDQNTAMPFRRYMEKDPKLWAKRLCDRVRDPKFVYRYLHPVITGSVTRDVYNLDINVLFVKLHLLDPTTVVTTFNYLAKALPDLNLELATTNYLGGPLEWTLIRDDVDRAIRTMSFPSNVSRMSINEIEVYHGVRVCEFIMSEARKMQLWTGKDVTDNRRLSSFSERCVIS